MITLKECIAIALEQGNIGSPVADQLRVQERAI